MSTETLFTDTDRLTVALGFLEEIRRTGKTKPKQQTIAIAHGLAFDPHLGVGLRLTPVGVERLGRGR